MSCPSIDLLLLARRLDMSVRPSGRLRFLLGCAAIPVAAALGAAVAISIPAAHAGLIPTLPTVTLPLPTVPDLPVVTTTTATTAPTGTDTTPSTTSSGNGGGGGVTTSTSPPVVANAEVAGAIRLPSGAFSIPVSSVTAPARLGIDRLTISPKWIGVRGQLVRVVVRVTDSRGYRVRGGNRRRAEHARADA
jgi:hypothetical protein